jgi:hypothetical protein
MTPAQTYRMYAEMAVDMAADTTDQDSSRIPARNRSSFAKTSRERRSAPAPSDITAGLATCSTAATTTGAGCTIRPPQLAASFILAPACFRSYWPGLKSVVAGFEPATDLLN